MLTTEIDFNTEADMANPEAMDAEVAEWAKEHGCTAVITNRFGPAGGAAVVQLTAPDEPTLRAALLVYCGGDAEQVEEYL